MRSLTITVALAVGCLGAFSVEAQEAKPTVELRTTTGQTTFHIGERISLTLSLTGPDNKEYAIDAAGYDRSGRLGIDTFDASPSNGWADPLYDYFLSQDSFMMGGLRGSEPLSSKPVAFKADLNEQIRFDQPGNYRITATSHRVGTLRKDHSFPVEPYLSLISNPIEIHIVPATPDWQAEKLRAIVPILSKPIDHSYAGIGSQERAGAIADLRFLNSPASIEMLAANLSESKENDLMWAAALGLSGVPDSLRDIALHAMSRQLEDPSFPVSDFFLRVMATLEAGAHETATELRASRDSRFLVVWQLAFSALPRKEGKARASTAEALLSAAPKGESAGIRAQIVAIVADTLPDLPIDRQISELERNWDELSRQSMLPVLQALIHSAPPAASPFYSVADRNAIILRRWYELDPDGALRELEIQLASLVASLSTRSIALLPGGPQPQFEAKWAQELVESEDDNRQMQLAALLVRFGIGGAAALVESKLNSLVGKWACAPQAAALGYVVKSDSDNAVSLVDRAMASTKETQCYESLFSSVSAYAHGPALNQAAVAALHNADPRAAADAALYLKSFGTEAAKQPLLQRYREWSEAWAGKADKVDPSTEAGYPMSALGQYLGEALIANQGWLSEPAISAEVVRRCVGEQVCKELKELASTASATRLSVVVAHNFMYESYQIGPYSSNSLELFEAKIDQFPKGTKFTLTRNWPQTRNQIKLEHDAEALFTKHGMTLEFPAEAAGTNASVE